jgi:DnaJ-domain-containing protein 1
MGWLGKVVGGTIGFAIGGPVGAVAGAAFGHLFDNETDSEKYYTRLECSKTDSDDTIKKQYRKMVRDYHPDTIAANGLPEEFVTFAHDKFREIQEAYEMVKKERGIS